MKKTWKPAIASVAMLGFLSGTPSGAETPLQDSKAIATRVARHIAQTPETNTNDSTQLAETLLRDFTGCVRRNLSNPLGAPFEVLQTVSSQCLLQVVLLDESGDVRPDANARMLALVEITGVSLPQPSSSGTARVPLQTFPDTQVYGVEANVGDRTGTFLLDTGASGSIVADSFIADSNLVQTPIPGAFLNYFAVGEDCSDIEANLLNFDRLSIDAATVQGTTGMTLPQDAVPGGADGVLGLDFLSRFDVVLDPEDRQLELRSPTVPDPTAIPLTGNLGLMTVETQLNGQPYRLGIDTGADLMVLSQRTADALNLDLSQSQTVDVLGFCGIQTSSIATLDRVQIGDRQVRQLDAVILPNDLFDLMGIDGLVGQNFLSRYRQHWRFGEANALGYPETGSLELQENGVE